MIGDLYQSIQWLARAFTDYKMLLERSLSFSDDAVHVFIGVLIQISVASILRLSVAHWRPLFAVVFLEVANEGLDISYEIWPSPSMQLGESLKDVLLTLTLPLVLFLASRWNPSIFFRPPTTIVAPPGGAKDEEHGVRDEEQTGTRSSRLKSDGQ